MSALYIHIPFCAHACPYCDFSFELLRGGLTERFIAALKTEAARRSQEVEWAHSVFNSVFLGGGTPTALTSRNLRTVFEIIREHFDVDTEAEITVEANPETLTDEKLHALSTAGVNRTSLGVQSLTEQTLAKLGRHHTVGRAIEAVDQIRRSGIPELNVDLIFGAPGQTPDDWQETVQRALELDPDHISAYGLTIEPDTTFGTAWEAGELSLPDESVQADLYLETIALLSSAGFQHYEVSNFAKPGFLCRHNLAYWSDEDYLGLGPSAHSHHAGRRFANTCRLPEYLDQIENRGFATDEDEVLSLEQQESEVIMLGLRMVEGLNIPDFEKRFGAQAMSERSPRIAKLTSAGFLEPGSDYLRLTRKGLVVADTVCAELM